MTIVLHTRCRWPGCGIELTDKFSRRVGYGSEHWTRLTPEQQEDAIRANQPGYLPKAQPPSARAVAVNAQAQQAAKPPTPADLCSCGSGAVVGRCPPCNRLEREPMAVLAEGVAAIIDRIRAQRTAERDAQYEAWQAAHRPEPEQLTIGA